MDIQSSRYRHVKDLEHAFHKLNRDHVQIKRNERISYNKVLYTILNELLKLMKKDDLFKNMKPRLEFMGSYYDGVRVGLPTEYDINVVLNLPINYKKIKLEAKNSLHDYTNVIMPSEFRRLCKINQSVKKGFERTQLWCDPAYRLSVTKFRSWLQSVVDAALKTLPTENGLSILTVKHEHYQLSKTINGPANTINIKGDQLKHCIDVDLVPTFNFKLPMKPDNSMVLFHILGRTKLKSYFVVPKPSEDEFSWRLSFPFQERFFINNKNYMKSVIKLLKLFRDTQGFKSLSSYFIKTLFLWESVNQDDELWKKESLAFLVMYMMKKLELCLRQCEIKNFWCPTNNLLENIKDETLLNWANRLSHIIADIDKHKNKNPGIIFKYFVSPVGNQW